MKNQGMLLNMSSLCLIVLFLSHFIDNSRSLRVIKLKKYDFVQGKMRSNHLNSHYISSSQSQTNVQLRNSFSDENNFDNTDEEFRNRVRLKEEVAAPFRKLRYFLYFSMIGKKISDHCSLHHCQTVTLVLTDLILHILFI